MVAFLHRYNRRILAGYEEEIELQFLPNGEFADEG